MCFNIVFIIISIWLCCSNIVYIVLILFILIDRLRCNSCPCAVTPMWSGWLAMRRTLITTNCCSYIHFAPLAPSMTIWMVCRYHYSQFLPTIFCPLSHIGRSSMFSIRTSLWIEWCIWKKGGWGWWTEKGTNNSSVVIFVA